MKRTIEITALAMLAAGLACGTGLGARAAAAERPAAVAGDADEPGDMAAVPADAADAADAAEAGGTDDGVVADDEAEGEAAPPAAREPRVEVAFDYARQTGPGSNQFAVWIADADGKVVKTLFVTHFTAGRGGWAYRAQSLPVWVADADIAHMTEEQVDAVTRPTPPAGPVRCVWRLDDADGQPVPPGTYAVLVEASLRGENQALYRAEVDIAGPAAEMTPAPAYTGPSEAERGMVADVVVRWLPGAADGE